MGLQYEEVVVTPEIATKWLAGMGVNRKLTTTNVEAIALAMAEGNWHNDGTPIRFNEEGQMIDGQHRCTAIVETGKTQTLFVVRNVPQEAMTTLDTGKSRSRSDVLSIFDPDLRDVHALAGAATIIIRWGKGVRGNALRNSYVSNDETVTFFEDNREDVINASRTAGRVRRAVGGVTAQAVALCAFLFARIDQTDAAFFWERVIDGVGLEKGSPILALRRFIEREHRSSRQNIRADIAVALMIKSWNAYRDGRNVEVLTYRVGGANPERFPEPV